MPNTPGGYGAVLLPKIATNPSLLRWFLANAGMAKDVERVRWLLEHGADLEARGNWGSVADYTAAMGSEEMEDCRGEYGVRRSVHGLAG